MNPKSVKSACVIYSHFSVQQLFLWTARDRGLPADALQRQSVRAHQRRSHGTSSPLPIYHLLSPPFSAYLYPPSPPTHALTTCLQALMHAVANSHRIVVEDLLRRGLTCPCVH